MTHWLQEHMWERYCARFPEKNLMSTAAFNLEVGKKDPSVRDGLYEVHMTDVCSPANTHFGVVLAKYLPVMDFTLTDLYSEIVLCDEYTEIVLYDEKFASR